MWHRNSPITFTFTTTKIVRDACIDVLSASRLFVSLRNVSICSFLARSVSIPVCLSVCPSLSVCTSIFYLSVVSIPVCLSVCPCLSVCLSVYF